MGVCLVLGASGIGTMFILKFVGNEGGASDFPAVILHTLVFHGGVMALVALFLKEQGPAPLGTKRPTPLPLHEKPRYEGSRQENLMPLLRCQRTSK